MIRLLRMGLMIIDDWVFAPGGETYDMLSQYEISLLIVSDWKGHI